VWVPDPVHEAMRDLVRARHVASHDTRKARTLIQLFLLKHGLRYEGKSWSNRHRRWLTDRRFEHRGQQIAFQSYLNRLNQAEARKKELLWPLSTPEPQQNRPDPTRQGTA